MNQEIVLFNFHKHPALNLYTAWHFQMDDGSKEYSLLQNDRIKRSLIRHINKFIRNYFFVKSFFHSKIKLLITI